MDWHDFRPLARVVYAGVRDGAVSPEAAFDLACLVLEAVPADPKAAELAEAASAGTDPPRLAELSRQLLADRFEPDFVLEPGWFAALEAALVIATADLVATGLPGEARLEVPEWADPQHAYVRYEGYTSNSGGIPPRAGSDDLWALVAVADDLQEAVMECRFEAWPVCPAHRLGTHAREHQGTAVWWCNGNRGHVAGAVGRWGR